MAGSATDISAGSFGGGQPLGDEDRVQGSGTARRVLRAVSSHASSRLRARGLLTCSFALLLLVLLVGPKFAAVSFANQFLWGSVRGIDYVFVLAQDLVLWWGLLALSLWMLERTSLRGGVAWWGGIGALAFFLLIDMRVRQLWLKPLDVALVRYYFEQLSSLSSSTGLFFHTKAGFGMSFRRMLIIAVMTHGVLGWLMLRLRSVSRGDAPRNLGRSSRWKLGAWFGCTACGVLMIAAGPRQIYALQDNLVVARLARVFTPAEERSSPVAFEQPLLPAREVLTSPRILHEKIAPFDNLVIVVLESFRYRDFELEGNGPTKIPNLRRFAAEGLRAKSYVSVPHSSKAIYAILSGRAPSARVEILEAVPFEQASVMSALRNARGARTSAFSAAWLGFENIDGLLGSLGVDHRIGPDMLLQQSHRRREGHGSYGIDDTMLVDVPARTLASQGPGPFATVLLTLNSHHPYVYPGKAHREEDTREAYDLSVEYTDRILGELVDEFQAQGVADNTLFVFVGDHGESFGEHGSYVHNNSLYEEEIAVPLVFWCRDGRLRHDETLEARQIDIAPTIADLMGLEDPAFETQGVSLLRTAVRAPAFVASFFQGVSQALVLDGLKYMYWPSSGRLVRFDLRSDPEELEPATVEGAERAQILERLHAAAAYEASVWTR